MLACKMPLAGTSGFVLPYDLVDEILLSQQFVKHQLDVVRRVPVKVDPHQAVIRQKILHHKDPYRHILDVVFKAAVKFVIISKVMDLMTGTAGIPHANRRVEARAGKERRIYVNKTERALIAALKKLLHILEIISET